MNPIIKKRLMGVLVLLALGVLFLPFIFVMPIEESFVALNAIPPRPHIDETPLPKPHSKRDGVVTSVAIPEFDSSAQAAADELTSLNDFSSTEEKIELIQSTAKIDEADIEVDGGIVEKGGTNSQTEKKNRETDIEVRVSMPKASELNSLVVRDGIPPKIKFDSSGFTQAWVLQVAAVGSEDRANRLVSELESKGYEAFSRSMSRNGKSLWRVLIGPKLEREAFDMIKIKIDQVLRVNSQIIRYKQ